MRWLFPLMTFAYCAAIFWLSHQPLQVRDELDLPHLDKVVHAAMYGMLALLAAQSLTWSGRSHAPATLFWAPFVFAALYGLTDEIHQSLVPAREFDPLDLVANTFGAFAMQTFLCLGWWRMPWRAALFGQAPAQG